jgi:hypothetical protein
LDNYENELKDAILLAVFDSNFEDIGITFKQYDTQYFNEDDEFHYELPVTGKCLVLLFLGNDGVSADGKLFTTIRRWTPEKERYYKSSVNETFEVVFTSD